MRVRKIVMLALVGCVLMGNCVNVKAAQLAEISNADVGSEGMYVNAVTSASKDSYEPNDEEATAYDYNKTTTINTSISSVGSLYTLGYKSSRLSTADDVDYYKVRLIKGNTIFADLRNIGSANYNMEIKDAKTDGDKFHYSTEDESKFDGRPEKYTEFVVPSTGYYYVKIYSLGDLSKTNYYFYVGKKSDCTYTIKNLCAKGTQLWGTDYQGTSTNMANYFPKSARLKSLRISNGKSDGKVIQVSKMIQVSGKNYYSKGTDEEMLGVNGILLNKSMYIAGKSSKGKSLFGVRC